MGDLTDARKRPSLSDPGSVATRLVDGIRAVPVALWLLLGLALVLRLVIVRYGLPQEFDPDEEIFVRAALRMIRVGSLDPDWYGQPGSTLIDGLAALYAAHGLLGVLSGASRPGLSRVR